MAEEILVINSGSSSVKVSLFELANAEPILRMSGQVEEIGGARPHATARNAAREVILDEGWDGGGAPREHGEAIAFIVGRLTAGRPGWRPAGVGHRVVHGGMYYQQPVLIDAAVRTALVSLIPLAPLHEPANLMGIDSAAKAFPGVPQVACFDTAFHCGRPFAAEAFALPRALYDEGVRRYGFHGISYAYIVRTLRQIAPETARGRVVVAHLGNGASMAAIHDGQCRDTTMSFTPVDGLPMGTRCGQLDPGVLLYLLEEKKLNAQQLSDLIYKQSGLLGMSGVSSDMRDLLASAEPHAAQAVDCFIYRVTCFVGALAAGMGGLDGLVFTAGIGEHASEIRERVCRNLAWLGLELDQAANRGPLTRISTPSSRVSAWVIPTDEERMIAQHVREVLGI